MKNLIPLVFFCFLATNCLGQKLPIDTNAINQWKKIGERNLSADQRFFEYTLVDAVRQSLVIERVNSLKKIAVINGGHSFNFVANDSMAAFLKNKDTLSLLNLYSGREKLTPRVKSYQLSNDKAWIVYNNVVPDQEVHCENLMSSKRMVLSKVINYWPTAKNSWLFLQDGESAGSQRLTLLHPASGKSKVIWQGTDCSSMTFDKNNQQIAFLGKEAPLDGKGVWYCNLAEGNKANLLVGEDKFLIGNLKLANIIKFGIDGKNLFLNLIQKKDTISTKKQIAKVDIWTYLDSKLQSEQLANLDNPQNILARIDVKNPRLEQLQHLNSTVTLFDNNDQYFIETVKNDPGASVSEAYWNQKTKVKCFLTTLNERAIKSVWPSQHSVDYISPDCKYHIYLDIKASNCYCTDLTSGHTINLTTNLDIPRVDTTDNRVFPGGELRQSIRWWPSKGFLIQDKYDIWLLDPSGQREAVNLTHGYGRRHQITFELADESDLLPGRKKFLLKASYNFTKEKGFFSLDIAKGNGPQLLSIGAYDYQLYLSATDQPLNSPNRKYYLVGRASSTESLNYFVTNDFKKFKPLTNCYPENKYHWLTAHLINFKSTVGYPLQGIIYKPQNLDPNKKYPVIIYYYDKVSESLNEFPAPALVDFINIPWYTDRGYIIVFADIHYKIGFPGESALQAIEGVAHYLNKLSYIDSAKIGLLAESWGAYQTSYIVTHSHLFAAAVIDYGFYDMVSFYGETANANGESLQYFPDVHQARIGTTLWDKPELFIKNSPIFATANVNTPILMMNNKLDGVIPFSQAVEFFTGLRRLGKPAWMLQYDNGTHGLSEKADVWDYTMRLQQFFDHYLKGLPAPVWMTRGIPASLKGTTDGFEYDEEIKTPPPSPLIDPTKDPKIIYDYNY